MCLHLRDAYLRFEQSLSDTLRYFHFDNLHFGISSISSLGKSFSQSGKNHNNSTKTNLKTFLLS